MLKSATQITADALRSPLSHLTTHRPPAGATFLAAELPNLAYIVLRGRADDAAFMSGVAAVLGAPLPTAPRSLQRCAAGVVMWQSPDEWWLVAPRAQRDTLMAALQAAVQGCFAQVADNSGGFTALHVSGAQHRRLLAHLSPYDFDQLAVGQCVSTVISKASFTVIRGDVAGVTLVFRRSFADYIWQLISRNGDPYGLTLVDAAHCPGSLLQPLLSGGSPALAAAA